MQSDLIIFLQLLHYQYFIPKKRKIVTAKIVSKEAGVLAGIMETEWFLKKLGIQITQKKKDGAQLKKNDVIMKLKGRADTVLSAERTLLNLLQRMSGVATTTNRLASKLPPQSNFWLPEKPCGAIWINALFRSEAGELIGLIYHMQF